jgi:hypothetical protein
LSTAEAALILPQAGRGRRSAAAEERYQAELDGFYAGIQEIASRLEFKVSSRGWCYILENAHAVTKGEFDRVERLINDGRKSGRLPLDICAVDSAREFDGIERLDLGTPASEAQWLLNYVKSAYRRYTPRSFWEDQNCYLQLFVEKIDLKSLFADTCREFRIPFANARGWSDINERADMMERYARWEAKGKQPVLLYCGDFDPVGLQISDTLRDNLRELADVVGWSPENLIIDRFGLNLEFVQAHGLTWIDGLATGSGKDLADPNHKAHWYPYVQAYLRQYGARKVEANAMVVRPDESRALFRATILRYLPDDAPARYQERLVPLREQVRQEVLGLLRREVS